MGTIPENEELFDFPDDLEGIPTDPMTIENLPRRPARTADAVDTCVVCLTNFELDDVMVTLPCVHKFHETCILPWLRSKNTCPSCRQILPSTPTRRIPIPRTRFPNLRRRQDSPIVPRRYNSPIVPRPPTYRNPRYSLPTIVENAPSQTFESTRPTPFIRTNVSQRSYNREQRSSSYRSQASLFDEIPLEGTRVQFQYDQDWNPIQQQSIGPGTVKGPGRTTGWVRIQWDNEQVVRDYRWVSNGKCNFVQL